MSSSTSEGNSNLPATCTLVIDNFSSSSTMQSDSFSLPSDSTISFKLCANSKIDMSSACYWRENWVSFSIYLNSSSKGIPVLYRMSIVNAEGQKCNTQEGKIKFSRAGLQRGQYIFFRDDLLDTANGWLVNNKLTVYCEVYLIGPDLTETLKEENSKPSSTILEDYGKLFESAKLSDLVLVAGGTEFKVHKLILTARSAVFAAMFDHDTKENQDNRVEINDVSAETCKELLRYIYTDKVVNLAENALDLMAAADKYQLEHLKNVCEKYLLANLATESVAITLVMADMHGAEALKTKCIEYISKNGSKVKATDGWATLLAKPELLAELFLHVSDKYSKL